MPWALRSQMSSYHSFKIPFLCMQARLVFMFDSGLQFLRGSKTSYDVLRDTKTSQFHPIIHDDHPPEKARSHLTLTKDPLQKPAPSPRVFRRRNSEHEETGQSDRNSDSCYRRDTAPPDRKCSSVYSIFAGEEMTTEALARTVPLVRCADFVLWIRQCFSAANGAVNQEHSRNH